MCTHLQIENIVTFYNLKLGKQLKSLKVKYIVQKITFSTLPF